MGFAWTGGGLNATDACVYRRDIEPTTATAWLENVVLLAGKRHVDAAPGTSCRLEYCYCPESPRVPAEGDVQILEVGQ